eukprot:scaffold1032_cov223-Pinguiococcus_pyrenoidosus.AAC.6
MALAAAVLLRMPAARGTGASCETLRLRDLFRIVASISYSGDFRMGVAEDPQKLDKLVAADSQVERFAALYKPSLSEFSSAGLVNVELQQGSVEVTSSPAARRQLSQMLPRRIRCVVPDGTPLSAADVRRGVADIVRPAALSQAVKGLWTAGVARSFVYAVRKLRKGKVFLR